MKKLNAQTQQQNGGNRRVSELEDRTAIMQPEQQRENGLEKINRVSGTCETMMKRSHIHI